MLKTEAVHLVHSHGTSFKLLLFTLRPSAMRLLGEFINRTRSHSCLKVRQSRSCFASGPARLCGLPIPLFPLPYISFFDLELPPSYRTALPTPFVPSYCPSAMTALRISTFQHAYPRATVSESHTSGVLRVDALYVLDIVPASRRFIFEQQSHLRVFEWSSEFNC